MTILALIFCLSSCVYFVIPYLSTLFPGLFSQRHMQFTPEAHTVVQPAPQVQQDANIKRFLFFSFLFRVHIAHGITRRLLFLANTQVMNMTPEDFKHPVSHSPDGTI